MFLQGVLGVGAGLITDKFGPRLVMSVCGAFLCLGYVLMSTVTAVWQMYIFFGVLIGIGMSGPWVSLLSTISKWFISRRSTMTGIVLLGTGIGTVIASPVANHLITLFDWRKSFIFIGITVGIVVIFLAQFLRKDPAQLGQIAFNNGKYVDHKSSPAVGFTLKEAIKTLQFWLICLMFVCFGIAMFGIMVHLVPHAINLGIEPKMASGILAALGGSTMIGRVALGYAGDKIGNRRVFIFGFILMAANLLWLVSTREVWGLYLFAVIFGIVHAGMGVSESPLVAGFFGLKYHGLIFGITGMAFCVGGALGPWMTGYIFDLTGNYMVSFFISASVCLIGLFLTILLKPDHTAKINSAASIPNHEVI
jgi:MFS family permease